MTATRDGNSSVQRSIVFAAPNRRIFTPILPLLFIGVEEEKIVVRLVLLNFRRGKKENYFI